MKHWPQLVVAAAILLMWLFPLVAGATSQGLNWAINAGDELEFSVDVHGSLDIWNQDIHIRVVGMNPIPDVVTSWAQIPDVDVCITWDNGIEVSPPALFGGLMWLGGRFCVPVGNFTLLEGLLMNEISRNSTIDFSSYVGSWCANLTIYDADQIVHVFASYLEADGFLATYSMFASNYSVAGAVRHGLPSDYIVIGSPTDIILIALAAAALVLLVNRRKSRRKSSAISLTPPLQYTP